MDPYSTFRKSRIIAKFLFLLIILSFSCTTKQVTIAFNEIDDSFSFNSNTRIIIKLKDTHPDHLLIYSPEEHVFYFYKNSSAYEEIIFEKELVIDPSNFKGIRYDENTGEQIEEIVFKTPGKYNLYFANNTETEPENTFFRERTIIFK